MDPHTEIENLAASKASDSGVWPRITLVTAVRNGAQYLEDTIRSIVFNGYPNLEYIIVDGASTDGTLDIIRKYESRLAWWVSQPDKGVYEALNTGFARSTGEIMGWLNASDMLHTQGLQAVGSVFAELPNVEWITGRPTLFYEQGWPSLAKGLRRWSRYRFLAGANRHIQQESTFWRRSLWDKSGGAMCTEYRAEGDFELWVRFFRHAQLYTVDALIAGWRYHADNLGWSDVERYDRNCDRIVEQELGSMSDGSSARLFRRITTILGPIPILRGIWRRLAIKALYRLPGSDWPPVIEYNDGKWKLRP
jgi:glycosyltransferase involved in cell wall biosynthesis